MILIHKKLYWISCKLRHQSFIKVMYINLTCFNAVSKPGKQHDSLLIIRSVQRYFCLGHKGIWGTINRAVCYQPRFYMHMVDSFTPWPLFLTERNSTTHCVWHWAGTGAGLSPERPYQACCLGFRRRGDKLSSCMWLILWMWRLTACA